MKKFILICITLFIVSCNSTNLSSSNDINSSSMSSSSSIVPSSSIEYEYPPVYDSYISDIVDGGEIYSPILPKIMLWKFDADLAEKKEKNSYLDDDAYSILNKVEKNLYSYYVIDEFYIGAYISDSLKEQCETYEYDSRYTDIYVNKSINNVLDGYRALKIFKVLDFDDYDDIRLVTFKNNQIPERYNNENLTFVTRIYRIRNNFEFKYYHIYLFCDLEYSNGYYKVINDIIIPGPIFLSDYKIKENGLYANEEHGYLTTSCLNSKIFTTKFEGHYCFKDYAKEEELMQHAYYDVLMKCLYKKVEDTNNKGYYYYYFDFHKIKAFRAYL